MAVKQVSVSKIEIEDRPGALLEVLAGIAGQGTNILQLAAFSIGGGKGEAYLVPDKAGAIEEYARSTGLSVSGYAGFLLSGEDRVGAGAEIAGPFADAGINAVVATTTVVEGQYHLLVVINQEDAEAAVGVMGA